MNSNIPPELVERMVAHIRAAAKFVELTNHPNSRDGLAAEVLAIAAELPKPVVVDPDRIEARRIMVLSCEWLDEKAVLSCEWLDEKAVMQGSHDYIQGRNDTVPTSITLTAKATGEQP